MLRGFFKPGHSRGFEIDLPLDSLIYGDKAYTHYSFEDELEEFENIQLIADRKKNLTRRHSAWEEYVQTTFRKRIETTFSQLTSLFPRKIHAVSEKGFLLKIVIFVVSFCIDQTF